MPSNANINSPGGSTFFASKQDRGKNGARVESEFNFVGTSHFARRSGGPVEENRFAS